MTDRMAKRQRSELMSRIRGKHTGPELVVRRLVHGLGYRYRLHERTLPGTPDLVFVSRRKVVLVHGCFWHLHNCDLAATPKTRPDFWREKFEGNVRRDRRAQRALSKYGMVGARALGVSDDGHDASIEAPQEVSRTATANIAGRARPVDVRSQAGSGA